MAQRAEDLLLTIDTTLFCNGVTKARFAGSSADANFVNDITKAPLYCKWVGQDYDDTTNTATYTATDCQGGGLGPSAIMPTIQGTSDGYIIHVGGETWTECRNTPTPNDGGGGNTLLPMVGALVIVAVILNKKNLM